MNRRLVTLAAILVTIPAAAQQNPLSAGLTQRDIQFRVLQQTQINLGDHKLILNRVAPPVFPPAPPALPPAPLPSAAEIAQAEAAEARTPQKKNEVLFLSATVYDYSVTEVRAFAGGRDYRFLSNIDFNLLAGLGSLETADTAYWLILAVGNETREEAERFNNMAALDGQKAGFKRIPQRAAFSNTRSEYVVAEDEGNAQPPAELLAALDALHLFYDANKGGLADEYAKREAARVEQEQWLKENPPIPQDTIVNFWPGKKTVILDGRSKRAKR